MWIDESLSFFFRRLAFSPDGNLLVVPGQILVVYTFVYPKLVCVYTFVYLNYMCLHLFYLKLVCVYTFVYLFVYFIICCCLAGRYESGEKVTNMTYVFAKSNLAK